MYSGTLNIGLVFGGPLAYEEMLFDAYVLMNQNLIQHENWVWRYDEAPHCPFTLTYPLKFKFSSKPITLWYEAANHSLNLREYLLPHSPYFRGNLIPCDGIIVVIHGKRLALDFLQTKPKSRDLTDFIEFLEVVYELSLPTVFALHDIRDLFPPYQIGSFLWDKIDLLYKHQWIDVWDLSSPSIQILKEELRIPDISQLVPYSYQKPVTVENVLKTLVAEIDKNFCVE